jgi:hypothetical protein
MVAPTRPSATGQRRSRVRTERQEMSLSEFEAELFRLEGSREKKKILLYGDSNVGKTVLAGTTPGRNFWLAGEPGYHSAVNFGARGYGRRVRSTSAALAALDWLRHNGRYKKFDWVIPDGTSTMEKKFRIGYAQEAFDLKGSRTHRNLPDKPDYFNTQNFMFSWVADLVDLDVNVLMTAHAYRTDKTDAELLIFPGFQGKVTEISNSISGLMDVVGYVTRNGDTTKVLFNRHVTNRGVTIYAGDKFNKLPKVMTNPTMQEILSILDGETEEEEDA